MDQKSVSSQPSDWQRVIDFTDAFAVEGSIEFGPTTEQHWRYAIRRFKKRAARDPDGFSRAELLHMSSVQVSQLLSMLREVELGQRSWPEQLLVGLAWLWKSETAARTPMPFVRSACLDLFIGRGQASEHAKL